jgi:hypothetical protein
MNQIKQTKKYEAPKIEFIETVSTAVLCLSMDMNAGMLDLTVTGGGWTVNNGVVTTGG